MSDKNETKVVAEETAKVGTHYDRKMAKRAKEAAEQKRDTLIAKIIGLLFLAAVLGFALSFPVRSIYAVNKTVCTVGGEKISQVKFDFYYNVMKSNFLNTYSSYLSYFGISSEADLDTSMYSDTLTYKQYIEELAVERIQEIVSMKQDAAAKGWTYDVTDDYNQFVEEMTSDAKDNSMTLKDYIAATYGSYATLNRIKDAIEDSMFLTAYYNKVYKDNKPSDAEIEAYYADNTNDYDAVDFYVTTISAELPTEPTELADEGAAVAEDGSYTPSDAEKEAAMEVAATKAEAAKATVKEDGISYTESTYSSTSSYYNSWLFDAERKAGDVEVFENTYSNLYYVVEFEQRYLPETPTVTSRAILTQENNGDEILSKFTGTEENFIELVQEYTIDSDGRANGGLYENQAYSGMDTQMGDWLFSADRKAGDVTSFYVSDTYTYVIYYVSEGVSKWRADISTSIQSDATETYVADLVKPITVEDPKNNLAYLHIVEEEPADGSEEGPSAE